MVQISEHIAKCHKNFISFNEPECMTIFGPTHVGKSEILTQYVNAHPPFEKQRELINTIFLPKKIEANVRHIPVLRVKIPCPASAGAVLDAIYEALKQPLPSSRIKNYEKESQLKYLLKICGIEMMIFDEVQHLIDRKNHHLLREPSDWLKSMIIDLNIPFILVGTREGEKIFENKQLRSRFKNHEDFWPFNYFDEKDQYRIRKVLQIIDDNLPLINESKLSAGGTWERIYLATNGKVPFIIDFIKRCTLLALKDGLKALNYGVFSYVFDKHMYLISHCKDNPFDDNFNLTKVLKSLTVDQINETFQPSTNNRGLNKKSPDIF